MCVPEKADDDVVYTLQYLKQKYDLVVLSNWFKESQEERLKRLGLNKYFSATYMTENIPEENTQMVVVKETALEKFFSRILKFFYNKKFWRNHD